MNAWPIRELSGADKEEVRRLVDALGAEFRRDGYEDWPADLCSDTASSMIQLLRDALGNHGFRWNMVSGYFLVDARDGYEHEVEHAWVECADGTIVDPTAGQFLGGDALRILPRDDPRYSRQRRW